MVKRFSGMAAVCLSLFGLVVILFENTGQDLVYHSLGLTLVAVVPGFFFTVFMVRQQWDWRMTNLVVRLLGVGALLAWFCFLFGHAYVLTRQQVVRHAFYQAQVAHQADRSHHPVTQ